MSIRFHFFFLFTFIFSSYSVAGWFNFFKSSPRKSSCVRLMVESLENRENPSGVDYNYAFAFTNIYNGQPANQVHFQILDPGYPNIVYAEGTVPSSAKGFVNGTFNNQYDYYPYETTESSYKYVTQSEYFPSGSTLPNGDTSSGQYADVTSYRYVTEAVTVPGSYTSPVLLSVTAPGYDNFSTLVDANFNSSPFSFTQVASLSPTLPTQESTPFTSLATSNASFLVGNDLGTASHVLGLDPVSGAVQFEARPFPKFAGGVRVAKGDVNGDGITDVVMGAGPGGGPAVLVYDGKTGVRLASFFAFEPSFTGGVYVSAADTDGDGKAEIIVGAGDKGAPRVTVFKPDGTMVSSFYVFESTARGGVFVATGDIDGDGKAEIIAGAGIGGGPRVVVSDRFGNPLQSFFTYDPNFRGGVNPTAADLDGDGKAEIITSPGFGGGPAIRIFDGYGNARYAFFADDPSTRFGTRVGTVRNTNGSIDITTTGGVGSKAEVKIFDGRTSQLLRTIPIPQDLPDFTGGLFISADSE